jgi:hypothetical protein
VGNCLIFHNENLLLFTQPKIASSWCKKHFFNNSNEIHPSFIINKNLELIDSSGEYNEKNKENQKFIKNIWNSLDEKNSRDIVFLFRNPLEHFISAFVQDFLIGDENTNRILKNLQNKDLDKKNEFLDKYKINNFEFSNNIIKNYFEISKKILTDEFKNRIENYSFEYGHFSLWLTLVNNLSTSNKLSKYDIQYIDIYSDDLKNKIGKYFNSIDESPIYSYKFIFDILKEIIDKSEYKDYIYENLKNEIFIYNKLKINGYRTF